MIFIHPVPQKYVKVFYCWIFLIIKVMKSSFKVQGHLRISTHDFLNLKLSEQVILIKTLSFQSKHCFE